MVDPFFFGVLGLLGAISLFLFAVDLDDARRRERKAEEDARFVVRTVHLGRSPVITPPDGYGRQELIDSDGRRTEFRSGPVLIELKADVLEARIDQARERVLRDGVPVDLEDIEKEVDL